MRNYAYMNKLRISSRYLGILMKFQTDYKCIDRIYLPTVICRHLSVCSSVVMAPHNSIIANENILDH